MKKFNKILFFFLALSSALQAQINDQTVGDTKFWATGRLKPITVFTDSREPQVAVLQNENYSNQNAQWNVSDVDSSKLDNSCLNRSVAKKFVTGSGGSGSPLKLNVVDSFTSASNRLTARKTIIYNITTNPPTLSGTIGYNYIYLPATGLTKLEPDSVYVAKSAGGSNRTERYSVKFESSSPFRILSIITELKTGTATAFSFSTQKIYTYNAFDVTSISEEVWNTNVKRFVPCPTCENYKMTYNANNQLIEQIHNSGPDSVKYILTYIAGTNRVKTITTQRKVPNPATWVTETVATNATQNAKGYPTLIDFVEGTDSLKVAFTYALDSAMTQRLLTAKTPSGFVNQSRIIQQYCTPCTALAPVVQSQPTPTLAGSIGQQVTVGISALNTQMVQWQVSTDAGVSWQNISPADTTYLIGMGTAANSVFPYITLKFAKLSQNGYRYRALLSNGCAGSVLTNTSTLALSQCTALSPVILGQPNATITAYVGQTPQAFGISGTNIGSFQWQVSTDGGGNWITITSLDSASYRLGSYGTTANGGNSVTVISPKLTQNGYKFRVIVYNGCAAPVTSSVGTLLVQTCTLNSPVIQTQPTNLTRVVGQNAVFSVSATNVANYEWYYYTATDVNTRNFINPSDTTFTGQSTNTLTLKYVKSNFNDYRFVCVIFNGCALSTSTNIVQLITTTCASTVPIIAPNSSTSAFIDFTANVGYPVNGACITITNGITSAQWQSMVIGDSIWRNIAATDTTYAITTLSNLTCISVKYPKLTQNGTKFRAILSNGCASVTSSSVTMTVITCPLSAPTITTQPTHKIASVASSVTFSLTSSTAMTYEWRISKDMGVSWASISPTDTTFTGALTNSLTLKYVKAVQNGNQFSCIISNGCAGKITSAAAILTVGTSAVNELDAKVKIYPNPASDVLNIEIPSTNFKLTLMDSKGTVLTKSENSTQLSVRDLPMGLYFINVKTNNGETTKKIIVSK
jgi:hypothetical protein